MNFITRIHCQLGFKAYLKSHCSHLHISLHFSTIIEVDLLSIRLIDVELKMQWNRWADEWILIES